MIHIKWFCLDLL
uniref:Uncharacterized protein n=1 Tax=Arundo donax TaxID=35708 RepID=A0A0A9C2G5_ARUDO